MPDQGVASWVSANDKPTTGAGSKPVSGDAAEQRLKAEVMQLSSRDRRRLKDISLNDVSHLVFVMCSSMALDPICATSLLNVYLRLTLTMHTPV